MTLAASAFFSGLASGVLGMLGTIMRPMLAAMSGRDFRGFMEAFLRCAEEGWGKVFNYAWSLGMGIGPIVALVLLLERPRLHRVRADRDRPGLVIVGVYVVSNVWKEPSYKVILGWNPEAMPPDWEAGRRRYFTINWIQLATTWVAPALFLVALVSL